MHHTKTKGDIAVVKTIADLTVKGYDVFLPISEHLPMDIIAHKEGKSYRIQCKYSSDGTLSSSSTWQTKTGMKYKKYKETDFDYYAIYLPEKDVVCYPSIKFMDCKLRFNPPKCATPFYWYEDFLDLTDEATKKTYKDFDIKLTLNLSDQERQRRRSNCKAPPKEILEQLISEKPIIQIGKDFGVSDNAVKKWCRRYGIETKPVGFWNKPENRSSLSN